MSKIYTISKSLRMDIESRLSEFRVNAFDDPDLTSAAVAVVIVGSREDPSIPGILLTLRPVRLNQHSGQYALPGGKLDAGETAVVAALRELDEELGLKLSTSDVLGVLDDYPTRSSFRITPVVIWAGEKCELQPSEDEVERVFHIPFAELDSDAIPVFEEGAEKGRPILCSEFPALGHRMYSPTASIIYQFREVAIRGNPTRVSHYDQPRFAWH